jgi:amidase
LQDLNAFTKIHPSEEYPLRNAEGLENFQSSDPNGFLFKKILGMDEYFTGEGGIFAALYRHRCDVLLLPTLSTTMQNFAAKEGSPVLSVPMGAYHPDTRVERDSKNGLVNVAPDIL